MTNDDISATDSWKYETCLECDALVQVRGNNDEYVKVSKSIHEQSVDFQNEDLNHVVFYHRRCTSMADVDIFDE